MKELYRQCELQQGNLKTVAWVPESGAKVGSSFVFKDDKQGGRWTVLSVGAMRIEREDLGKSDVFDSIKPKIKEV
jgi:hypothetical protein